MRYPHRRRGRGRKGIAFGSGSPVGGSPPPWMNYRAAYIAPFGNSDYDNLTPIFNQLAGTPEYELFLSQASISQARVNNFRALWPDAYLLAYLILFNLQWDPDNGTYGSLVQAIPDRWLRKASDDSLITLSSIFGYYFWEPSSISTYLLPWLTETGTLKSWTTKYDGFFLDNLPWRMPFGAWQNILNANGGAVKVAGDTYTDQDDLIDLYQDPSQTITNQIKTQISSDLILVRNAAAYSNAGQTVPIVLDDPSANGLLWEPIENTNAATVFSQPEWNDPKFGIQFVSSDANYATIQGLTWPDGQFFGQGPSVTGRL